MQSHLKIWGRICFQTHSVFWQNVFPCDHILEDSGLLLAIGWRSPLGPRSHPQFLKAAGSSLPCGITQHDFWFHLVQKKRLWLQSAKQNLIYHNLKMGMNHLCHIPLVRSKSQVQQHLRKENYTKAWISGVGLIDNHLRVYLPWEALLQDDLVESFHWTTTYASVFKSFLRFLIFLKENIPILCLTADGQHSENQVR